MIVAGWIFVEMFLPRIMKKKRPGDNPFAVRDRDFDRFISYFMPGDWAEYLKLDDNDKQEKATKRMVELRKKLFEKYPAYYEQIDKRFIKNYFG